MEENSCEFVSSRGLVKICDIHPDYNHHDGFTMDYLNKCCDIPYGTTIYVHFDILRMFIKQILPYIRNYFVLVCGSTDLEFPRDFQDIFFDIEYSEKILNFWCQNCTVETRKIHSIPIGLDYHCMSFNTPHLSYGERDLKPVIQEQRTKEIIQSFKNIEETKAGCITNFHLATEYPKRERVRVPAYQRLKDNTSVKFLPKMNRYDYFKETNEYFFMISPSGNGLDTHRTWEALILNRVPIVNDTGLQVYDDLPIIQLQIGANGEGWEQINKEFLEEKKKEIICKLNEGKYNLDKLRLSYWEKLFNKHKKQ
jgi:hypothetical protein